MPINENLIREGLKESEMGRKKSWCGDHFISINDGKVSEKGPRFKFLGRNFIYIYN